MAEAAIPAEVQRYLDGIDPAHRPLFDRLDGLVRAHFPDVEMAISYQMPTYRRGEGRLYVGAWKHGISLYGWGPDNSGGFVERHPELTSGKGTIRLRPEDAAEIDDAELSVLVLAALGD